MTARWFKIERLSESDDFFYRAAQTADMFKLGHLIACWKAQWLNCDVIEVLGPVKNTYASLPYEFSKSCPNSLIKLFIICAGVEMRRCFWRDLKRRLRHSPIIELSNKLLGDPIGTCGPSEQLGKKSRPILRVFQFWTNVCCNAPSVK